MLHGNGPQRDTVVYGRVSSVFAFVCVQTLVRVCIGMELCNSTSNYWNKHKYHQHRETQTPNGPEQVSLGFLLLSTLIHGA